MLAHVLVGVEAQSLTRTELEVHLLATQQHLGDRQERNVREEGDGKDPMTLEMLLEEEIRGLVGAGRWQQVAGRYRL